MSPQDGVLEKTELLFFYMFLDLQIWDLDLQESEFFKTPVCKTLVSPGAPVPTKTAEHNTRAAVSQH